MNRDIELFRSEVAKKVGVEFADRRSIADSETAIYDLDGQLAVSCRSTIADPPYIFQVFDKAL